MSTPPTARKPVLGLSISSSLALRNFFQAGIVEALQEYYDVHVFASPAIARTLSNLGLDAMVPISVVDPGAEPTQWKLFRQIKKKVHLEGRASATEAIWERFQIRPAYQRIGGAIVKRLIRLFDAAFLYSWLDRIDLWINSDRRYVALIREKGVAVYFATHATSYWEESMLRSAIAAGIPRVYMVLSWDHLSSKVLLHENFGRILVWNRHTRNELLETYPRYRPEQVEIVGIPQYDAFLRPSKHTYASWCAQYGLDPAKRTILFSTMPQVRHDQQHVILEDLLKEIVAGREVPSDLQVLIKCHPFDSFSGYTELVGRYPVAIRPTGLKPGQEFDEWVPSATEVDESRDCLYFCTVNINIFSTVTIEAAFFDKPIIHIAYDPLPVPPGRIPCREYYNWEHFKHIVEKDASLRVHGRQELFDAIRRYTADPSVKATGRRRVVEEYIGDGLGQAASRVAAAVAHYSSSLR